MQNLSPVSDDKDIVTKGYVDEVKSAAAINRSTLGYSGKNLLDASDITLTAAGYVYHQSCSLPAGTYIVSYETTAASVTCQVVFKKDGTVTNPTYTQVTGHNEIKVTVPRDTTFVMLWTNAAGEYSNIMIRNADITDSTYEPYVEPVDERITNNDSDIAINKSTLGYTRKNLFKLTISTQTKNGITFTVNDDKSITASGTQSLQTNTSYLTIGAFTAPFDGDYILTGYPTTDTSVDTNLGYLQYGATVIRNLEHKLTMSKGETIHLMLCVKAKCTLENRVFIPMVRLADITDPTFEPYVPDVNTRVLALEDKQTQSGTLLASTSIGSSSGDITIENLSAYSSAWAYIDGNSGVNFATNVIIPIAYLTKSTSNSVKLAGGIPSDAYITSSGPQAPKDTSAYITAKVSGNVLSLSLSSGGTIGNVTIVAM